MQEETLEPTSADETYVNRGHQLPAPDARPHRSTGMRILVWVLILLGFALLFWLVLRHHTAQTTAANSRRAASGPVAITTITAHRGNIGVYLEAIGTVTPVHTASITSEVTGMVSAVYFREGQLVHRGQPLVDIDPRIYQAQLLEAEGALQRDKNLLAQAQMNEKRYQEAWARDAIPKQTLDDQEKLVLQYEGTVKIDQGTVQYNQVQVSFCHIVAPISGRVGLRLIDPGNVVQANSANPLVVITQLQPITVVFTIPEDSIGQVEEQIRHGRTLTVTAFDRANQATLAVGKLETVDNQIDTTTGTLKLRAVFANADNALFPNLFVNTRLLVRTLQGVTLIPTDVIQQNGDTSYVYVIQNETAHLRDIKTGVADSGMTAVAGINPGDMIADSSFEKLQDKARITLAKTRPVSSPNRNAAP